MHACARVQMHAHVRDTHEYVRVGGRVRKCALVQTSADIRARLRVHALNAVHALHGVHALHMAAARVAPLGRFVA